MEKWHPDYPGRRGQILLSDHSMERFTLLVTPLFFCVADKRYQMQVEYEHILMSHLPTRNRSA